MARPQADSSRANHTLTAVTAAGLGIVVALIFIAVTAQGASSRALAPAASSSARASATIAPDPKDQPLPPGYTTPPGPPRYPAATQAQLEANLLTKDVFVRTQLAELTSPGSTFYDPNLKLPPLVGAPVFVRSIVQSQPNVWLVPILQGTAVIGVFGVLVQTDGTGAAGFYSGWEGGFPHKLTIPVALVRGSAADDPGVTAELVAATVSPMEGGPASPFYPMYRVVRASGAVVYVFQSGNVAAASDVHPY